MVSATIPLKQETVMTSMEQLPPGLFSLVVTTSSELCIFDFNEITLSKLLENNMKVKEKF
jgi:hypothetical protein